MMITVEITADETFNKFKKHKFGYLGGRDFAVSDDGTNWEVINHYPDLSLTDSNTALIGAYYYIASDNGIWKTKDFNTFTKINAAISDSKHTDLHSFEWFQDLNGSWFIKYNATAPNDGIYTYWADFDETTDSFVDTIDQFKLPLGDTSGLAYVRGNYYIWMAGDKLYKAADFKGKFKEVATDISGSNAHQLFSSVVSDNYLYVYFIDGNKTYLRSSKTTNLIHWSKPVEVADVGLGSYFYNANAVTVYPSYKRERTFDKVLKVTANGFKQTVPISCMVFSSLQVQWEQNGTWQIDFTAYDDGSVSYAMLAEEAEIVFNGQAFIVKQAAEDAGGGIDTKQITASHVYNEINRVRQRKTKTGTLTYTVNDVLSFYLDDRTANPLGFTYHVYGNFDKQQIENLGNSSGSDMISKILDQWPKAIVYPDNKEIKVYTPEAFEKDYGGRIDYLNNSSDVKMTVDSTGITNQVKVFGKQVENTSDNATDDSKIKYYFEPFIVEDKASIRQYKLHPMDDISDERFTNKDAMQKYAQGQLSPNPAISIEITMEDNEMPIAGEKRHLIAKPLKLETDLAVIGYTWHPFDSSQKNSLSFANLPASILQTQASINSQIRKVQLIAQQAINSAKTGTRNYVSDTDPMQNDNNDVRAGDIWTLPLLSTETQELLKSVDVQDDSSANNQTIYTDPDSLSKTDVQLSIWNGSRWLEISNQRTINTINDNQHKVADQVAEQQKGIAKAVQDAQAAVTNADKAIEQAGFANDTAKTAKEVADSVKEDVAGAKSDSATALQQAKDAMKKAQQAIDGIGEGVDLSDIQKQIDDVNTSLGSVSSDLETAKKSLDEVSKQAKTNGESIVSVTKDVDGIKTDVAGTQGNVTQVVQQAKELSTAITNAKGDISTLQQTATQLSSSIKDNTDNISSVKQTATKLSSDMKDAQGNISSLQQSATNLSSTIGTIQKDLSDTQKTVSSQGTQITQNAKDITSKANSTDLDATNKRMTTAETSIKQSAKDITSKASQSDVNTLTGRVKTAESNISQNANSIKSKVSSSDVQGILDKGGYATQTWTGSQINQKATEISSTVASVSKKADDNATALSKVDQKADSISSTVTNNKKNADSQFSNINQTISGIQTTVKNKADSSTVTQLDKLVQSKVDSSTYNSKVTQLANAINLRVQTKDLISQINQQAGGNTLIQVASGKGKLYLDAETTVFSGKAFIPSAAIASLDADKIDTSKFSIGSGKYSIDMTGNDGIDIGSDSNQWSVSINSGTLHFAGSDNKQLEYVGGLDYTIDTKNSNTNGFGAYVYTKQRLGAPYGGDYFAIGEAIQKKGDTTILSQDVIYAPNEHSGYIPGITFNKHVFVNADSQLVFTSGGTNTQPKLVFSGFKDSNAGIYMDTYGNIVGNTSAQQWWVKDKNLNTVLGADVNGSKNVYIGGIKFSGGSMYIGGSNGLWVRNENGSLATINAGNFAKGSTKESKKNIKKADIDKLATNIYNMDITTFNYKNDCSADRANIGAVIGDGYHIDDSLLTKNEDAVMIDNVVFALVATAQKQAQQISELTTELTALKIKEQNNE